MATIKSEYYRFNGVRWELHYFKTSMDMVDGLSAALAGKATKEYVDTKKPTWADIANKPSWIGASKPTYTAAEVGALPTSGGLVEGDVGINGMTVMHGDLYINKGVLTTDNPGGITYEGEWFDFDGARLINLDTPLQGTDAATKQYVDTKAGPPGIVSIADTGTVNLTSAHMNKFVLTYLTGAGDLTLNLTREVSDDFPTGTEIHIARMDSADVIITSTGVTIRSEIKRDKIKIAVQYGVVTLKKISATIWILYGELKS